jgi:hypothetical protein
MPSNTLRRSITASQRIVGMDLTEPVQRIQNTRQFDVGRLVREADCVVVKASALVNQPDVNLNACAAS